MKIISSGCRKSLNIGIINQEDTIGELTDKINRLSKQLDQLQSFVTYEFIEKSKASRVLKMK